MLKEEETKPTYYKGTGSIDVIDAIKIFKLNFNLGNILKYIVRAGIKSSTTRVKDLKKAREYLDREIKYHENYKADSV